MIFFLRQKKNCGYMIRKRKDYGYIIGYGLRWNQSKISP
jgi:hypothetical protein